MAALHRRSFQEEEMNKDELRSKIADWLSNVVLPRMEFKTNRNATVTEWDLNEQKFDFPEDCYPNGIPLIASGSSFLKAVSLVCGLDGKGWRNWSRYSLLVERLDSEPHLIVYSNVLVQRGYSIPRIWSVLLDKKP